MATKRKTKDATCVQCGKIYRVPLHWSKEYKRHCSRACQREHVEALRVEEIRKGKAKSCRTCGKEWWSPYRSNRIYCRPLCRPSSRRGARP